MRWFRPAPLPLHDEWLERQQEQFAQTLATLNRIEQKLDDIWLMCQPD
jgi:hypothetical protein